MPFDPAVWLFIPTRGRLEKQLTWNALPAWLRKEATLVCPPEEVRFHESYGRRATARPVSGISNVRQWLVDAAGRRVLMMSDDDHRFYVRRAPDDNHLRTATDVEVGEMLVRTRDMLVQGYAMAGLSTRQGNNNHFPATQISPAGRCYGSYAVDCEVMARHQIRFDAVELMEDFHVQLALLEAGEHTVLLTDVAWGQDSANSSGGCSTYRTAERQERAARQLHALHPQHVTVVTKESTPHWKGDLGVARVDVRIQWAKAALAGAAR